MPKTAISDYDLIILGAGPIGLACGIAAKQAQLRYLILEKGCLVNSVYQYPTNMTFFSTSDKIELGGIPFVSHGDRPTRREALEYFRKVAVYYDLNIQTYQPVHGLSPRNGGYLVQTSKGEYTTRNVVIATGFFTQPNLLQVPGEDLPKVKHYFDDPHPYCGQRVLVVGGGNSAVDVALETYRKGAQVTLVVRQSAIKEGVKYWVRPDIENRIKEGAITAYFNSQVTHIRQEEVDILTPGGLITLPNDFVLAMTGYHPNFEWMKQLGVETYINDEGHTVPQFNPKTFETNLPNVFLAGTVCGGTHTNLWFIENSRYHAEVVMQRIALQKEQIQ
jgi:thioredoxin reductase (NADPH)